MGTNYKLKGKIVEAGLNQTKLAKKLGLTNQGLSNKITGRTDFTQSEISQILNILEERDIKTTYEDIF